MLPGAYDQPIPTHEAPWLFSVGTMKSTALDEYPNTTDGAMRVPCHEVRVEDGQVCVRIRVDPVETE